MNIRQNKQLKFDSNGLSQLNYQSSFPIYFVYVFIYFVYGYVLKKGIRKYIKILESIGKDAFQYEEVNICLDAQTNLIYIFESRYDYKDKPTTPEIEQLLEEENFVQLCRMNFFKYAVMTKENFINFLLMLEKIITKRSPFILLYLDDENWYDVLPFDSLEAMEKFVAEHTK